MRSCLRVVDSGGWILGSSSGASGEDRCLRDRGPRCAGSRWVGVRQCTPRGHHPGCPLRRGFRKHADRDRAGQQLVHRPVRERIQAAVLRARGLRVTLLGGAFFDREHWPQSRRRCRRSFPFRLDGRRLRECRSAGRGMGATPAHDPEPVGLGSHPQRSSRRADGARDHPPPGAGLLRTHELGRAQGPCRLRGPRLECEGLRLVPDLVRRPGDGPVARADLLRRQQGRRRQEAGSRHLEVGRQSRSPHGDEQGLVWPTPVRRSVCVGVLRDPAVGTGGSLVGRRRCLLATYASLCLSRRW